MPLKLPGLQYIIIITYNLGVVCSEVPLIGNASYTTAHMIYGDTLTISCLQGYWFTQGVHDVNLTCLQDGSWNNTPSAGCKGSLNHIGF